MIIIELTTTKVNFDKKFCIAWQYGLVEGYSCGFFPVKREVSGIKAAAWNGFDRPIAAIRSGHRQDNSQSWLGSAPEPDIVELAGVVK